MDTFDHATDKRDRRRRHSLSRENRTADRQDGQSRQDQAPPETRPRSQYQGGNLLKRLRTSQSEDADMAPLEADALQQLDMPERSHLQALQAAERQGALPAIRPPMAYGSATLAHLSTPYVDRKMNRRRQQKQGVDARFYTPKGQAPTAENAPPRRQISAQQIQQYQDIQKNAIAFEQELAESHYAFYHAQDPRMRIAQDVYKRVYERHHQVDLPQDFHFLRFPGPEDHEFDQYANVHAFFEDDMKQHGMIDDNINPTKSHIISANVALHGGLGHAGEETFHYFQIGQGQTELPIAAFIAGYLEKFGLDASGAAALYEQAKQLNATAEGSLFQIMIPKTQVDDVAYMAHPHGLPHDDQLFHDLHTLSPIRYPQRETAPPDDAPRGLPPREKMNDEVTRNLQGMQASWGTPSVVPPAPIQDDDLVSAFRSAPVDEPKRQALLKKRQLWDEHRQHTRFQEQTQDLHARTLTRFREGEYQPSRHLEDYIQDPGCLQHPQGEAQALRMDTNPEHFGGQGIRSEREVMRIQNRANFMQARVLLSQSHMLNPETGIQIKRHTTMTPEQEQDYNQMLDQYVQSLYGGKRSV